MVTEQYKKLEFQNKSYNYIKGYNIRYFLILLPTTDVYLFAVNIHVANWSENVIWNDERAVNFNNSFCDADHSFHNDKYIYLFG